MGLLTRSTSRRQTTSSRSRRSAAATGWTELVKTPRAKETLSWFRLAADAGFLMTVESSATSLRLGLQALCDAGMRRCAGPISCVRSGEVHLSAREQVLYKIIQQMPDEVKK